MPTSEYALIVLLGHVANEVNTIDKITYLSSLAIEGSELQIQATAAQTMILSRVLIGKLYEGWEAIQSGYFGSRISQTYVSIIDDSTSAALDRLKRYFSRKNLLGTVRNEFAFHYSVEHATAATAEQVQPEEMAVYLHERPGALFFQSAEFVMNSALARSLAPDAPETALTVLLGELRVACNDLNEFVLGVIHAILLKRVGPDAIARSSSEAHVPNAPTAMRKRVPYFIELP